MLINSDIYREYDIRGVYNEDFSDDFAYKLAQAFSTFCINTNPDKKSWVISLGHDVRLSSPSLYKEMLAAFKQSNVSVYELGLVTSPMSYFSSFIFPEVDATLMITASHNPKNYNGFKMSLNSKSVFGTDIQKIKTIIDNNALKQSSQKELFFINKQEELYEKYIARYAKEFKNLASMPLALDCGNGVGACIAEKMYQAAGLSPIMLFDKLDGNFPNHHPDPTIESNLKDLKKVVLKSKLKIGIALDGDADRLGVLDEKGNLIAVDKILSLFSQFVLKKNKNAKIVGDVKCSNILYQNIKAYGGQPIMWKTGHSLIKTKIADENSPFGGEFSGHIFFADRNYGYDDALYAGLRLIEIMTETGLSITELLKDYPNTYTTPELRIEVPVKDKSLLMKNIIAHYKTSNTFSTNFIDGVRIETKDSWGLIRASHTQSVIVVRCEATTSEGLEKMLKEIESQTKLPIKAELKQLLNG
ncbi:MAG: phosphomannomutase/phosphoglucomutase [Bdellovibrionaceae bacterium]|nr:phosphomannomutase/phosphoglucomutase [Pseudobdellovibrionaceae bacterium]